ncbi:DUF3311 domain-containing protein [Edaphobacter paludis]|uniref:DUF3311 domain-containing protein n=1 Tax=Edaphobacter paludis TaxID=3035702 RepID=A0AAU7D1E2_9BACT
MLVHGFTLLDLCAVSCTQIMRYALQHMEERGELKAQPKQRRWWLLLLVLPYLGLCFPQMYARATPALWGFPFFYWYQFAWVIAASALLGVVYWKFKE